MCKILLAFVKTVFIFYYITTMFVIVWLIYVDITSAYGLPRPESLVVQHKEGNGEKCVTDTIVAFLT
jgi:hypothetical protein